GVQGGMGGGGDGGRLGGAAVDHPAPLVTERWIDLAAPSAVIAIAELVLTHELAVERGPHQRAKGRPVPPGEEAQKKRFHRRVTQDRDKTEIGGAFMPPPPREVHPAA